MLVNNHIAATILDEVGSVGMSLFFWVLGFIIAACSLAIYLELASYFPNRSGAEVVYLEVSLLFYCLLLCFEWHSVEPEKGNHEKLRCAHYYSHITPF